jgi:predicted nucleotidyltransferase
MRDIQALVERIVEEFHPQRIILFGSYAQGRPTPDSDVDLLVVLPFQGKGWQMASEIRRRARPTFAMDLLVRTPDQVRQRLRIGDVLLREIAQHGKVLYAAPGFPG